MKFFRLMTVVFVLMLALTAVSVNSAQGDLGSADNPIQVLFVPSGEVQFLVTGGELLAEVLSEATGLSFEVEVPTSYAATIEAMCAAPESTMGFIPALGYVLGNNRCGIEVEAAAVRFGWPVYWAQYVVRRDSNIYTFGDLEGRTWAYGDVSSTSGYLFPLTELGNAGITPGEQVATGGHGQTILAVYNGEADFGTTYFSPPLTPGAPWNYGDSPEPYDLTIDEAYVTDEGRLYVGDIRILDARSAVASTAADVVDQVRILRISNAIPNDTLSFGPEFPEELRQQIIDSIITFSETEAWFNSALGNAEQGYNWTSIAPIDDSNFDIIRDMLAATGQTEEDIFGEG